MELFPHGLAQVQGVALVERHIHVGGVEGGLAALAGLRRGGLRQVHEVEGLGDRKTDRAQAAHALEPEFAPETGQETKPLALEPLDPAVEAQLADGLERRVGEPEGRRFGAERDRGAARRDRGQVHGERGGLFEGGQERRILPFGGSRRERPIEGRQPGESGVESPSCAPSECLVLLCTLALSAGCASPRPRRRGGGDAAVAMVRGGMEGADRGGARGAPARPGRLAPGARGWRWRCPSTSTTKPSPSGTTSLPPRNLSRGQYGSRAGLPRVLDLLDRRGIRASFFIPAVSALIYREDVADIVAAGHEIGVHGWIHERNSQLPGDEERRLIEQAVETLTELTGRRPVGIRTPSWDYSPNTLRIVRDLGFLYDSSLMADDWPYEVVANGEPTGVVELPVEWILDDAPYFGFSRYSALRPHSTPDDVLSIWKAEFDMARAEGGMFLLTMHPHVIGHRSRMAMLERLIEHMDSAGGVWYATHEEVARYALQNAVDGRPE